MSIETHPSQQDSFNTNRTTFAQWFLSHYQLGDSDSRTSAIRAAVASGYGRWIAPDDGNISRRPATHQHEITVLDITAVGASAEEAVRNWFKVAAVVIRPSALLNPDPDTMLEIRRFALCEIASRFNITPQVAA
jgi:hypothetical protein